MYRVEVRANDGYTTHSDHDSYKDAVDQADMVHGRVVVAETGLPDEDAYGHALANQGFLGTYEDWQGLDDAERDEYERGASGEPTA